jgi:membrane protease YdiL (CAAX protease family)
MSILAALQSIDPKVAAFGICLLLTLGIVVVSLATKLFQPAAVTLPDRIPVHRTGWTLFAVLAAGLVLWIGSQAAYGILLVVKHRGSTQPFVFNESSLTAVDFAFLATVPPLIGMLALLLGDALLGREVLTGLGYGPRKLQRGMLFGLLAMLAVLPLMLLLSFMAEGVYNWVGYEHPKEHMLLKVLGESHSRPIRWLIIIGATVGAPLFEELLFRAHLQTLIRRLALWVGGQRAPVAPSPPMPRAFEVIGNDAASTDLIPTELPLTPPPLPPLALAYDRPLPARPAWPSWVAIILTSLLFALVHELWTAPLIFVLAMCLGYAYERTNNLWVPITMHAFFNTASTALFLAGMAGAN